MKIFSLISASLKTFYFKMIKKILPVHELFSPQALFGLSEELCKL